MLCTQNEHVASLGMQENRAPERADLSILGDRELISTSFSQLLEKSPLMMRSPTLGSYMRRKMACHRQFQECRPFWPLPSVCAFASISSSARRE